ncbi:MAG: metallophosphatase family protein [Aphanocapsa sp. GSE-SYN-MK-11-07L]|jgi:diadenosine tetraphosphatase ApaH/serine/threonine PP2A family protein phosphatase|nr:metallophosphatase family protein [Aphanocapsa sp. GSE-SYN-MK-11-07L]
MKLAVISCIHGNSAALDAVLSDIDHHHAEQIYCLGDLVGYGPDPNAVVETIRALAIPTCQGCWDEDIVVGLDACECSYPSLLAERRGKLAHAWTSQAISPETREFLAQLPLSLRLDNLCFVHGSPNSQHEYLLPEMDESIALERVMTAGAEVLFCGHTHIPYVRTFEDSHVPVHRIINAGSVGEPRHGRPNATYVLYETETQQVTLREVEYDYQATCAAILAKGLPPIFAWRLARGLEFAERADDPTHICDR